MEIIYNTQGCKPKSQPPRSDGRDKRRSRDAIILSAQGAGTEVSTFLSVAELESAFPSANRDVPYIHLERLSRAARRVATSS